MSNDRSDTPGTNSQQDGNGECFVIAPIGSDGSSTRERTENLFNHVIQPVMEEDFGFKVIVAHKIDRPGNITRQVMELLFETELVIADLTEHNPNVMYELAVRHATGEPVVTIAQEGTTPPFDIGPQRTKFYKNTLGGVQDFKRELRSAVEATLEDNHGPDNPIYRIQKDFQMRETVSGDDNMQYVIDRLDSIESAISGHSHSRDTALEFTGIQHQEFIMKESSLDRAEEIAANLTHKPELFSAFAKESRGPGKSRIQVFAPEEMDFTEIAELVQESHMEET